MKFPLNTFLIFTIFLSGCIMIPEKYLEPITKRNTNTKKTIAVEGFSAGAFQSIINNDYYIFKSYNGGGVTLHDQYIEGSSAEEFRGLLVSTGCFTVVAPNTKPDLVFVGSVYSQADMSWHYFVQFLEGLTLTPILGVPIPERGSGFASANVYKYKSGELIESVKTKKIYLSGWLTIYSSDKEREGLAMIRTMALRDLAEELADRFCK